MKQQGREIPCCEWLLKSRYLHSLQKMVFQSSMCQCLLRNTFMICIH